MTSDVQALIREARNLSRGSTRLNSFVRGLLTQLAHALDASERKRDNLNNELFAAHRDLEEYRRKLHAKETQR